MKKVLRRFVDIWKLDFLARFFAKGKKDNKTTIGFWVLSNIFVALIISLLWGIVIYNSADDILVSLDKYVPDHARVTIRDGQLTTENIDDPFFREIVARNTNSNRDGSFAVIIDSHSSTYDITSLDEYDGGVIVFGDRMYFKNGRDLDHIVFSDVPNISISKEAVERFITGPSFLAITTGITLMSFVVLLIYFALFRLIVAFWWALLLFILMYIFEQKEEFMTIYKAVLNLYFIPTIVIVFLSFFSIRMSFFTTIIFVAVFLANLIWQKKHPVLSNTSPTVSKN